LATEAFHAKALAGVVVDVFTCTTCFDMGHVIICSLILKFLALQLDLLGNTIDLFERDF
jgi:hypothetical protein